MAPLKSLAYNCTEALRIASLLIWPFAPTKMEELWRRLACGHYADALANNGRGKLAEWATSGQLQPGAPVIAGEALFPRYQAPGK